MEHPGHAPRHRPAGGCPPRRARRNRGGLLAASLLLLAPSLATAATDPEAVALLRKVDDLFRGESSTARISMHVKTGHFERTLTLEAKSKGTDKSLIRILAPAKEKGVTTLKVGENLWNYLPKVDRTIKVPASMMSGAWMGSHFTNDDLVQESRLSEDYDSRITGRPDEKGAGDWVIELTPKPDSAVVWGKVVSRIRGSDLLPVSALYYDEKGKLVRTLTYDQLRDFGGRQLPARMKLVPEENPEEYTEILYEELDLGAKLPDELFSLRALKN